MSEDPISSLLPEDLAWLREHGWAPAFDELVKVPHLGCAVIVARLSPDELAAYRAGALDGTWSVAFRRAHDMHRLLAYCLRDNSRRRLWPNDFTGMNTVMTWPRERVEHLAQVARDVNSIYD